MVFGTTILHPTLRRRQSKAEVQMMNSMSRQSSAMVVQQQIQLRIRKKSGRPQDELPPCSKVKKSVSWSRRYPLGFWSNNRTQWNSLLCKEPKLTSEWAQGCLQNTTVWILGDSNSERSHSAFSEVLKCRPEPRNGLCRTKRNNATLRDKIDHELPYYSHVTKSRLTRPDGVQSHVASIPSTGRHVVVFHYYLHASRVHPDAYRQIVTRLKATVQALLKRNPDAHVFIRGPHISTVETTLEHMMGGDVAGPFQLDSLFRIFRDMRDRVTFLDGWGMSISTENRMYHPEKKLPLGMVRTLLSFMCS